MPSIDPLSWNTPMVDKNGRPTKEFQIKWQQLARAAGVIPILNPPGDATQYLRGTIPLEWGNVKDSDLSLSDIVTNDVSTTMHGFAPKLPNDPAVFLDGEGNWTTPAGGGGGLQYAFPMLQFTGNDAGAFATLSNGFVLCADIEVSEIIASFNAAAIGNVYSAFIAAVNSSGTISSTVVSATSSFTTTATGAQQHAFAVAPTTLTAGQNYIVALVITSGITTTACRAVVNNGASAPYSGLPLDMGLQLSQWTSQNKRYWYTQNSNAPGSGAPAGNSGTGQYALGLKFALA